MNTGSLNERITRALAFMLRHQPDEFDLELDRFGWGDLEDVVYALQERLGSSVDEDDVLDAIEAGDRPRYEVKDEKIRALYGHSFQIDPGEATEPPDELFIGVGSRDADRADEHGLRSGRRAFLHLARTEEEARETGRRIAKDYAVVTVFAGEAYDDGIDFYDRGALFLADEIPVDYLEVGDMQHDGIEREHRGRSRGRRGGSRGGSRGRGGRDRDRDDRGPRDRGPRDRDDARRSESRDEEPRREPRPEPRSEPRPEPKRREEPARAPREEAAQDDGGFGLGLDSGKRQSEPRHSEDKRAESKRSESKRSERPAREERAPEPAPKKEAPSSAPASGFGAGLE